MIISLFMYRTPQNDWMLEAPRVRMRPCGGYPTADHRAREQQNEQQQHRISLPVFAKAPAGNP
jgi:hypothetical protein